MMMMISMIFSSLSLNTCLTPGSVEPRRASAAESGHSIHAGCAVQTQIRFTVVYVHLAQSASVSIHTFTPNRKCETKSVIYHMSVVYCIINIFLMQCFHKGFLTNLKSLTASTHVPPFRQGVL